MFVVAAAIVNLQQSKNVIDYTIKLVKNLKEFKLYFIHCIPLIESTKMPVIDTLERTLNVEMRDADRRQSNQMLKYMDQQANPLGVEYEVIIMEESRSTEDLLEGFVENYSPDLFLIGSRPDRSNSVDSIARQFTIGQPLDVDADDNYGLDSGNTAGLDFNNQLDMIDDEQELSPMRKWLFSHSLTQYLVDNLQCAVLVVKWENQH